MSHDIMIPGPPSYRDIPEFTPFSGYEVDVGWWTLERWVGDEAEAGEADLDPDFQRGHVWTQDKKIAFVEFMFRGGESCRNIYFNCPNYQHGNSKEFVLVDGKQRLDAALGFLGNKVPIFGGHYRKDFTDKLNMMRPRFRMCVNGLKTRAEVLQWYLDLNTGGVVHTTDEIDKVKALLAEEAA